MSDPSTVAFRAGKELRSALEEVVKARKLSSISELMRMIAMDCVTAQSEIRNSANAPQTHELDLRSDLGCPLLRFVATERCNACPYRERAVVSREEPSPGPPTSAEDETSKLIDDLFEEDEGKT